MPKGAGATKRAVTGTTLNQEAVTECAKGATKSAEGKGTAGEGSTAAVIVRRRGSIRGLFIALSARMEWMVLRTTSTFHPATNAPARQPARLRRVASAGHPAEALTGTGLGDFHHPVLPQVRLAVRRAGSNTV